MKNVSTPTKRSINYSQVCGHTQNLKNIGAGINWSTSIDKEGPHTVKALNSPLSIETLSIK
jgi:hypothetical protein